MESTHTQPTETIEITIREVAYPGRGVGDLADGRVIFVDGALPGETVEVAITRQKKRFAEGRLISIVTPSPARIIPSCPLAERGTCPGCTYQHVTYDEELAIKSSQLTSLLTRLGGIENPTVKPPVGSPNPLGYRNKITLRTGRKPGGKALGYLGHNNRTIVNITACPLAAAPIQKLLDKQREDLTWLKSLPRDTRVTFRHTETNGALWWHERAAHTGGPRLLTEQTCLGELRVPRTGFFQVNPAVASLHMRVLEASSASTPIPTPSGAPAPMPTPSALTAAPFSPLRRKKPSSGSRQQRIRP
jgi:predicted RNA-binding protein with TRAM domain